MKSASTISTSGRARKSRAAGLSKYPFDTVDTRGRKREARRWLEVLGARSTNGRHEPHPLKMAELYQIHSRAIDELEQHDRVLFEAVHQCMWDNVVAEDGMTLKERLRRSLRRGERIEAIRKTLPPRAAPL